MKTRNIIFVLSFILFNSCIVKSLHPFYTKETISFKKELAGEWTDNQGSSWEIIPFNAKYEKENDSKEIISFYNEILKNFKKSYLVSYKKRNKKSIFLATPFTINNQLFLDFVPVGIEGEDFESLFSYHLIPTHSLVKLDVLSEKEIKIKWFDNDRIAELFKENRIKIKHEKTGVMNDDIVLTASSEEIQVFLKKYLTTENAKKWETSTEFVLTKS